MYNEMYFQVLYVPNIIGLESRKMKNCVFLAVTCTAIATSSQATAQSTVTLYGIIDNSIQYTHNTDGQSSQIKLQSGQISPSQWGMRGVEDLGGGLKTIFDLENGFNANTGALSGGQIFGRKAYVGLSGGNFGSVTVGRQSDVLEDIVITVQGDYYLEYFTAPGDVDNADGSVRISNSIKWTSPTWSGLKVATMYSFGNVAGAVGSGQSYSTALSYDTGPVTLAGGYFHADNGNAQLSTRGSSSADSIFFSAVNQAYATASAVNIARVGAKYAVGPVTLGGYYSYSEYVADGSSTFKTSERYNNGSLFALWQVSPATQFEVGYDYLKSHGDSSATYDQITVAGDYLLSKRTDIYASAGYGHASGQNGAGKAQAVIADTYADAGSATQEIVMLGIRHRF
jgi:predicted porin